MRNIRAVIWALLGGLVLLYGFFLAIGGVDPAVAHVATYVAAGVALLWLLHAWRHLLHGLPSPRSDRERRGF